MSAALLDKGKIRQAFAAAAATYDGVAELQRSVGKDLLRHVDTGHLRGTLLDLGCGTGFLTEQLLASHTRLDRIIALDLAWPMLQKSRDNLSNARFDNAHRKLVYVCADAERLPFAEQSLDGVYSNLALQWCNHFEGTLTGIRRLLKPGSPLVFSTFGPDTLGELKHAWAQVDTYSHVNDFYTEDQVRHFLERTGFSGIQAASKRHVPRYASVNALMRELKQIGAHNVSNRRNKKFTTKAQMQDMIAAYEAHRSEGLIPATFDVIKVVARA